MRRLRLFALASAITTAAVVAPATAPAASAATTSVQVLSYRSYALNYAVTGTQKTLVRWNPCRSVHYRVNTRYAAAGALTDVKTAFAKIHAVTGITFVYDGTTAVIPQKGYGQTTHPWSPPPLVVAWARPGSGTGRSTVLSSSTLAGEGGWAAGAWTGHSALRIVSGYAVLNAAMNRTFHAGFGSGVTRGALLLHELGHAVGLAHASVTTQIMYPTILPRTSTAYGSGDIVGLKKVGRASGCIA